jgi:hypothetical protein
VNRNHRLDRVESALQPQESRFEFHRCTEHEGMPWDEHVELHRQLGEYLFTLDLGAANVREDV